MVNLFLTPGLAGASGDWGKVPGMAAQRFKPFTAILLLGVMGGVSGCALPVIGALTLNELSSTTSFMSTGLTGKGLGEHALDLVTGQDCRVLEGVVRSERGICARRGSPETADDFKGLIGLALGAAERQPSLANSAGAKPPVIAVAANDYR